MSGFGGVDPAGRGDAGLPRMPAALLAVRQDLRRRAVALAAAGAVGLVSRTLPRAVAAGVCVGTLALAATGLASPSMDAGEFFALSPLAYVAAACSCRDSERWSGASPETSRIRRLSPFGGSRRRPP